MKFKISHTIYSICSIINLFFTCNMAIAEDLPINTKKILFLGDSLTAGYGLEVSQSYPSLILNKLQEGNFNYSVINAGISGDTTAGGLSRIKWLLKQEVSIVVIALGANDAFRGFDTEVTKNNLTKIVEAVREKNPKIKILLAGMLAPPNMGVEYGKAYNALFSNIAAEKQLEFVPFLLKDVASKADLNLSDGIHPNEKGYLIIAETVWSKLKPML